MLKILAAVHGKRCSKRAVHWIREQFSGTELAKSLEVELAHVVPSLPPTFWDDGHILGMEEQRLRAGWVESWISRQKQGMKPVLEAAVEDLVACGFSREKIRIRFLTEETDVADALLEEARTGGYGTLVIGRCNASEGRHILMGSVTSKVIHRSQGLAICVVE